MTPDETERNKLCDDFENMKAGLESQIATLGEHCNQLLKDKGNLTDELNEKTKDLLNANHRIEQLEQQIEKMKCGQNCKHEYWVNTGGCYDQKCRFTGLDCTNCKDKWKGKWENE